MSNTGAGADFIIAGAGCAGLSLALALKRSAVPFRRVLLVDNDQKTTNDRTWCFWTRDHDSWYTGLAHREWQRIDIAGETLERGLDLSPYRYYMVRGLDFYAYCHEQLRADQRFEFVNAPVERLVTEDGLGVMYSGPHRFTASRIFNSAVRSPVRSSDGVRLVQQFRGQFVNYALPHKIASPVLMDFRVTQQNCTSFMYLLPLSETRLLAEYTVFTDKPLPQHVLDAEAQRYLGTRVYGSYDTEGFEQGEIPMTEDGFTNPFGERITNIGVAGNAAKPGSGYAFYFIQRDVAGLVKRLEAGLPLNTPARGGRFSYYDSLLLRVLAGQGKRGHLIFESLFRHCRTPDLLAFLNEESSFMQDLRVIRSMPSYPFLKEAIRKLRGRKQAADSRSGT